MPTQKMPTIKLDLFLRFVCLAARYQNNFINLGGTLTENDIVKALLACKVLDILWLDSFSQIQADQVDGEVDIVINPKWSYETAPINLVAILEMNQARLTALAKRLREPVWAATGRKMRFRLGDILMAPRKKSKPLFKRTPGIVSGK